MKRPSTDACLSEIDSLRELVSTLTAQNKEYAAMLKIERNLVDENEILSAENCDIKHRYDRQVQITEDYLAENSRLNALLNDPPRLRKHIENKMQEEKDLDSTLPNLYPSRELHDDPASEELSPTETKDA